MVKGLEVGAPRASAGFFSGSLVFPIRLTALKSLGWDHGLMVKAYDESGAIVGDSHVTLKTLLAAGERGVAEVIVDGSEVAELASFKMFQERKP